MIMNLETKNVYIERTLEVLLNIGEFLLSTVGVVLMFVLWVVGFFILGMIGLPVMMVVGLLEWILMPIPYYIATGLHYYEQRDSLLTMYFDFIDNMEQMATFYGWDEFQKEKERKLQRLKERLDKGYKLDDEKRKKNE